MRAGLILLCVSLLLPPAVSAESPLQPLLEAGQLTIDSSMTPATGVVPGERALLHIQIGTGTWFTGGARIRLPEVPGLVILQTEDFAANSSERRDGQTWVMQRWTIDVYPQQAGLFTIGPIEVTLKVNGGELGNLEGPVLAPATELEVIVPEALTNTPFWVAAPEFSARQSLDRETDALTPGDAFERRVEFRASDVQAMMLPTLRQSDTPGLAAYPGTPNLENRMNRGQSKATRIETVSYVAEQPGDYLLPAEDFFWWNTKTNTLEVITVPAVQIHVEGDVNQQPATNNALRSVQWMGIGGLVALGFITAGLMRYRPWRWLAKPIADARRGLVALRQPGLPSQLNPGTSRGSSAADRKAS